MSFSKGKADRVSLDVEQLLQSLKEHGTIESEDRAFTLSLSRARRYLASNQSSSPHRFLVALAAGAFLCLLWANPLLPMLFFMKIVVYSQVLKMLLKALKYAIS